MTRFSLTEQHGNLNKDLIAQLDNPFWQYSLCVYANPLIQKQCLTWQEQYNINVNVLLFCCWLASSENIALTANDFNQISKSLDSWHTAVVLPLRQVRQYLKQQVDNDRIKSLRQQILKNELAAEAFEQAHLYQFFIKGYEFSRSQQTAAQQLQENMIAYFSSLMVESKRTLFKDVEDFTAVCSIL